MFVFLKKRIFIDTNNEALTKAIEILERNKIKHELRTVRSRGTIGSRLDSMSYARSNIATYKGSAQPGFVYMLYVKRRDFAQAKKLVTTK